MAYVRKVMEDGKLVDPLPPLKDIRRYCMDEMMKLPAAIRRIEKPETYPVKVSRKLLDLCARLSEK